MNDNKFTWDKTKAKSNERKRGVSFEEATTVFYDDFALEFFDESTIRIISDKESNSERSEALQRVIL